MILTQLINTLDEYKQLGYNRIYVEVVNNTKNQYIRYGHNSNGASQMDVFLIDGDGNVLNDIQWDFDKITSLSIYPIPSEKMQIKNGKFITNNIETYSEAAYSRSGK